MVSAGRPSRTYCGGAALVVVVAFAMFLAACGGREQESQGGEGVAAGSAPEARPVHEAFSLTEDELTELLADARSEWKSAISRQPRRFLGLLEQIHSRPAELLWQVDREHPAPDRYEPSDLVPLDDYADRLDLSREGHRIREIVLPGLFEMVDDARSAGVTLLISSVYRSHDYQAGVYAYWVETVGQEEADRISAAPGTSQHQLGTTIDFGCICDEFAGTKAGMWLAHNAWRYGFSLSYPPGYEEITGYAYESWHYRYIGQAAAEMEREFFQGIQYDFLAFAAQRFPDFFSRLMIH